MLRYTVATFGLISVQRAVPITSNSFLPSSHIVPLPQSSSDPAPPSGRMLFIYFLPFMVRRPVPPIFSRISNTLPSGVFS